MTVKYIKAVKRGTENNIIDVKESGKCSINIKAIAICSGFNIYFYYICVSKYIVMSTQLLFISGAEIFIILIVILLLFGSKKIPEIAKGLGKGLKEFKKATDEIKKEITDADIIKDVNDIKKNLKG